MEDWKDINGYEGLYQVSNFGRVKSIGSIKERYNERQGHHMVKRKEKILANRYTKSDDRDSIYDIAALYKNKIRDDVYVHRLVVEHFISTIPEDMVVNHKDFDGTNNRVDNLEIITQQENTIHYHSRNGNPLYNKELMMKLHHGDKMGLREIGRMFNTSHGRVKQVLIYHNIEVIKHKINQFV